MNISCTDHASHKDTMSNRGNGAMWFALGPIVAVAAFAIAIALAIPTGQVMLRRSAAERATP